MTSFSSLAALTALLLFTAPAPGPQGEGGVTSDTPVAMFDGTTKAASDLVRGDELLVWDDAHDAWTKGLVVAVSRKNSQSYWVLKTASATLRGSANLWLAVAPRSLTTLSRLDATDQVFARAATGPTKVVTASVREYPSNLQLVNIDLVTPGLFVASGLLVHD